MMGIMAADEHLLIMDLPHAGGNYLNCDNMAMLRDAGARTVIKFYCWWDRIEPQQGVYDWSEIDAYVESRLSVGFKVILNCYTKAPAWCPVEWYAQTENGGPQDGVLSPWNKDAMECSLNFCRLMRDRYNGPTVLVANGWLSGGETIFLNEPAWFDPAGLKSYETLFGGRPVPNAEPTESWLRQTYLGTLFAQQEIFVENPWREIWLAIHPAIANFPFYGNGCKWHENVLSMYRQMGEDVEINQIYYTWIQWSYYWELMRNRANTYRVNVFGGAEYAEGAPHSSMAARANGLRGLICAPCHPFTGHTQVEPWMVDNLRQALENWFV